MSSELRLPDVPLGLGGYIAGLIAALGAADPAALVRMRHVVGRRRARIALDAETVDVTFVGEALSVRPAAGGPVHGEGSTDRATVLDLLDGHLEVADAILDGRLAVRGATDALARMFTAIEILLDAAPRVPALQALAAHFRRHAPPGVGDQPASGTPVRRTSWYPEERAAGEDALLAQHDLLPG